MVAYVLILAFAVAFIHYKNLTVACRKQYHGSIQRYVYIVVSNGRNKVPKAMKCSKAF